MSWQRAAEAEAKTCVAMGGMIEDLPEAILHNNNKAQLFKYHFH